MKFLFSILWALTFSAGFCAIYFGVAVISSAHFSGNAASSVISVSPRVFGVTLVFGLVGFILGLAGKLPGTK